MTRDSRLFPQRTDELVSNHFKQDRLLQARFLDLLDRYGIEQSTVFRRFERASLAEPRRMLALIAQAPTSHANSRLDLADVRFLQEGSVQREFERLLTQYGLRLSRVLRAFQQAVLADESLLLALLEDGAVMPRTASATKTRGAGEHSAGVEAQLTPPKLARLNPSKPEPERRCPDPLANTASRPIPPSRWGNSRDVQTPAKPPQP